MTRWERSRKTRDPEVRVVDADPTSGLRESCSSWVAFGQPSTPVWPVILPGTLRLVT